MLGALIDSLDDAKTAAALIEALDEPDLARRLDVAAKTEEVPAAELMASVVRFFMETASDDLFVQLIGIMNRADDPTLAALRTILLKALPEQKIASADADRARRESHQEPHHDLSAR